MKSGSIHIRKATPRDVLDVQSCARAAFAKYIGRIGREPAPMNADFASQLDRSLVYVAEVNGEIAGYVVFYVDGKHVHLENVAVWLFFKSTEASRATTSDRPIQSEWK